MAITFTDDQAAAVLDALGLPGDTTDPQLVAATAADMAAQVAASGPSKPSAIAAAAKAPGLEVIDADTAAALRHDAAQGRKLAAAAARITVEAAVDDAITKGKITAARRKHWVTLIEADPEMADVLASTPNELAVPMTEVGHSADIAEANTPTWFYQD